MYKQLIYRLVRLDHRGGAALRRRAPAIGALSSLLPMVLMGALLGAPACSRAQNSGPERDAWQRPGEVLDELHIHAGSVVADVGCGRGYFTFKMADRVGPEGRVYAEDVDDDVLESVRREAKQKGVTQVETILGKPDDPGLPTASLDVVLAMNTYHEWRQYDAMLQALYRALKPGGLLALIDGKAEPGRPRADYYSRHRMPEELERADAERNGFHFLRTEPGFTQPDNSKEFYFLVMEKPG